MRTAILSLAILGGLGLLARAADTPAYRVLGADKGRIAVVEPDGKVSWEIPCKAQVHDMQLLPSGNLLYHDSDTHLVEVTPDKKVVWTYESKPKDGYRGRVEVHAFQRLADGNTMIAESGNGRIIEVDPSGKIVHEIALTIKNPHPHRDTRMARKLDNGHYLVCHEGDGTIREYDASGKVVWSYELDLAGRPRADGHGPEGHGREVFGALRLPSGNTLISAGNGNRVFEIDPEGKTVWALEHDDLPGIQLGWITSIAISPRGNVLFGNCHAGPKNPQLIEVNRDKQVVWSFKNFQTFGNSLAVAKVIGEDQLK